MIRCRRTLSSINSSCRYYDGFMQRMPTTRNNCQQFRSFRSSSYFLNKSKTNNDLYCIKEEICMPMGDGHVEKWLKKEGDFIRYEEPYNEIYTDYFPFSMTHDDPYTVLLHKIVAKENEEVKEGDVLCIFLRKEEEQDAEDNDDNDDDVEFESRVITSDEINEKFNNFK